MCCIPYCTDSVLYNNIQVHYNVLEYYSYLWHKKCVTILVHKVGGSESVMNPGFMKKTHIQDSFNEQTYCTVWRVLFVAAMPCSVLLCCRAVLLGILYSLTPFRALFILLMPQPKYQMSWNANTNNIVFDNNTGLTLTH